MSETKNTVRFEIPVIDLVENILISTSKTVAKGGKREFIHGGIRTPTFRCKVRRLNSLNYVWLWITLICWANLSLWINNQKKQKYRNTLPMIVGDQKHSQIWDPRYRFSWKYFDFYQQTGCKRRQKGIYTRRDSKFRPYASKCDALRAELHCMVDYE